MNNTEKALQFAKDFLRYGTDYNDDIIRTDCQSALDDLERIESGLEPETWNFQQESKGQSS